MILSHDDFRGHLSEQKERKSAVWPFQPRSPVRVLYGWPLARNESESYHRILPVLTANGRDRPHGGTIPDRRLQIAPQINGGRLRVSA
jgi:hypothetical protein